MPQSTRPSCLQFSLRTIVWIMLCAGIGFGGYRQGFQDGRNYKEPPPKPPFGYAQVYYVEDLLTAGRNESAGRGLDDIREQITANVLPTSWTDNGGKAQIRRFDTNLSLVVMQDQSGHEQVAGYFESLRANAPKSDINSP